MAPFRSRTYRECEVGLHGRVPENRRQRWAERENTRRQATHVAQMSRWRRIGAELEDLFRISHGEPPHTVRWPAEEVSTPASTAPWFVPAPDERVLCRTPGVWMVEADQPPGEPTPGFGGYSALAMAEMADAASSEDGAGEHLWVPGGYRPVESGWVTVTDQRVVFQASGVWEWPFERLLLIEHSRTEPVTMLHVSGSESVYGLRYAGVWASAMRFALSSAVAGYADDGAGFRAALRADRQQHAAERPPTPPPTRHRHRQGPRWSSTKHGRSLPGGSTNNPDGRRYRWSGCWLRSPFRCSPRAGGTPPTSPPDNRP